MLNAAVILEGPEEDPADHRGDRGRRRKRDGLPLKAISWQKASGIIGQFVTLMRASCSTSRSLIIFMVALVIINNALVMATLERVREIGTLRAIGAQRRFILAMLVIEALVVGLVFGGAGRAAGRADRRPSWQGRHPRGQRHLCFFFFSGRGCYPFLGTSNVIGALVIVLLVSAVSSFYPAWLAMRVTPAPGDAEED